MSNAVSVEGEAHRTRFADLPLAYIELHSHCNRDCPFCPRYHDRTGRRKDSDGKPVIAQMPSEKVFALLDQLAAGGYRGDVGFFHNSDPFLDKRYLQFAHYAVGRGMRLRENTNGDVLKNNPELCEMIDGLVSILTIGLYDYSTYAEKQETKRFWQSRFKKTELRFSSPWENLTIRQFSETSDWLVRDERVLEMPCQYRRDYLFIAYDGTAVLCCQDDYGAFGLGNVFEDGIDHVMFSAKRKAINDILDQPGGRHHFPLCQKCYAGVVTNDVKTEAELADDKIINKKLEEIDELFHQGALMSINWPRWSTK